MKQCHHFSQFTKDLTMMLFTRLRLVTYVLLLVIFSVTGVATAQEKKDKLREVAVRIDALMAEMAKKAEADKDLAKLIAERRANIQQAEQNVTGMIARLTELTKNMDDDSVLRSALKEFEKESLDLIAYAEASNDDKIKGGIPSLRDTLNKLKTTEGLRSGKVQEARALIRSLEDDKTRIVFFYKAGQLQAAADQLSASVTSYASIVDGAKAVAGAVLSDIAAR
jgi:hypothetical protein